jgi:uncharacterized protein YegP (UPF0339 family)
MAGWFEVSVNDRKQYSFVLKAPNAHVILRSEQYESKAGALGGVASVQVNSPHPERYQLATASDGRFYFNLRAANSQVIGTSQMYMSEGARTTGMESVAVNGRSPEVREI